jgi:nucleotide-binding universal stress UspA family protein
MIAVPLKRHDGRPLRQWKNILVPTDFSAESEPALQMAVQLAGEYDAKITLLHVVQMPPAASVEAGETMAAAVSSARAGLDQLASGIPLQVPSETSIYLSAEGVAQGIVRAALEDSADLIVIATHAYSLLRRIIHGSQTEGLLHRAPCPVLVVRRSDRVAIVKSPAAPPQESQAPGTESKGSAKPAPPTNGAQRW